MDGSATFTTVLSSMIMNRAKHIAASVHQRRLSSLTKRVRRRAVMGRGAPWGGWRGRPAGSGAGRGRGRSAQDSRPCSRAVSTRSISSRAAGGRRPRA